MKIDKKTVINTAHLSRLHLDEKAEVEVKMI